MTTKSESEMEILTLLIAAYAKAGLHFESDADYYVGNLFSPPKEPIPFKLMIDFKDNKFIFTEKERGQINSTEEFSNPDKLINYIMEREAIKYANNYCKDNGIKRNYYKDDTNKNSVFYKKKNEFLIRLKD